MRLLIVDDDSVFREELSDLLADEHHVATAASVPKAIEELEREDFDVVFTDLKMPRHSGLELLHEIRRRWPTTLVVLVTGFATVETAVAAMKDGAFDYVRKPFQLAQIAATLERAREQFRFERDPGDARNPDATARRWSERAGLPVLQFTSRSVRSRPGVTVAPSSAVEPTQIRAEVESFFAAHPTGAVVLESAERLFEGRRRADSVAFLSWLRDYLEGRGPLLVSFDADRLSANDANDLRAAVAAPRTRATLEALGNPIRRAVLRRIARGPCSFSEAMHAAELDDSPKLAFHLKKLVDEGLVAHVDEEYRVTPLGQESVRLLETMDAFAPRDASGGSATPAPARRTN